MVAVGVPLHDNHNTLIGRINGGAPFSNTGRVFTILLILCGSGVLIYGISVITAFVVEGKLTDVLRRKKMDRQIGRFKGHYIVCSADQTGRYILDELIKTKKDFIVIEKDPEKVRSLKKKDILCLAGDATHDAVLQKAGIQKAKGLITALHFDAENSYHGQEAEYFTAGHIRDSGSRIQAKDQDGRGKGELRRHFKF
jgi:hypothetical protein